MLKHSKQRVSTTVSTHVAQASSHEMLFVEYNE